VRAPGPVVFFGTPDFAVPSLEALSAAGTAPVLVVTQPARAVGRGRRVQRGAVAEHALSLGLTVREVASVKTEDFIQSLEKLDPWVVVVVAFGQILPPALLAVPRAGCVNLHASLLPKYRGAAPIQAAIAAGDAVTGVTTMLMTAGLDEGPLLLQREVRIGERETAPELARRLAVAGAELLITTLEELAAGDVEPRPQDDELATYAPRLGKDDGRLDWRLSAAEIFNRWRAFTPWPGLTTSLRGVDLKILDCRTAEHGAPIDPQPGTVVEVAPELVVACGRASALVLERVQRPGRRTVRGCDLVNGERLRVGELFEPAEPEPESDG
jgi:methionyl-tRNA formyltransferase